MKWFKKLFKRKPRYQEITTQEWEDYCRATWPGIFRFGEGVNTLHDLRPNSMLSQNEINELIEMGKNNEVV